MRTSIPVLAGGMLAALVALWDPRSSANGIIIDGSPVTWSGGAVGPSSRLGASPPRPPTRLFALDRDLAQAEPKRLRFCLLHTAG